MTQCLTGGTRPTSARWGVKSKTLELALMIKQYYIVHNRKKNLVKRSFVAEWFHYGLFLTKPVRRKTWNIDIHNLNISYISWSNQRQTFLSKLLDCLFQEIQPFIEPHQDTTNRNREWLLNKFVELREVQSVARLHCSDYFTIQTITSPRILDHKSPYISSVYITPHAPNNFPIFIVIHILFYHLTENFSHKLYKL